MTRKKFMAVLIIFTAVYMPLMWLCGIFLKESAPFHAKGCAVVLNRSREVTLSQTETDELLHALSRSRPLGCCTSQKEFGVKIGEYSFYPAADFCPCMDIYKGDTYFGGYEFYDSESFYSVLDKLSVHLTEE